MPLKAEIMDGGNGRRLLITKWTLQRWKLCLTSLLKDKTSQPKIAAYSKDFFVLRSLLLAKEALFPFFDIFYEFIVLYLFSKCMYVLWALMCHRASSTFQTILVSLANKLSLHRLICNAGDSHRLRRLHHS